MSLLLALLRVIPPDPPEPEPTPTSPRMITGRAWGHKWETADDIMERTRRQQRDRQVIASITAWLAATR
jgi:hypothetical protein